jgi:starch phosphorylase
LGDNAWLVNLSLLSNLTALKEDESFREEFAAAKLACKQRLVDWVYENCGIELSTDAMFDIMTKRIHEYKR